MAVEALDESDAFVSEVCWHYYVNEMTQAQVAGLLGVTRLRVNQAIQKAKALGNGQGPASSCRFWRGSSFRRSCSDAARHSQGAGGAGPARRHDYHVPAGAALADYIVERLRTRPWKKIGVSWGMTLQSAINRLPRLPDPDLEIVSMIGGTNAGASFNAFGIASGFAERFSARLLAAGGADLPVGGRRPRPVPGAGELRGALREVRDRIDVGAPRRRATSRRGPT